MKKFRSAAVGLLCMLLAGCMPHKVESESGDNIRATLLGDGFQDKTGPCAEHPAVWLASVTEHVDSSGEWYKEAIWTSEAPCDGAGECTLLKHTKIRFYRDVQGETPTGQPVEGTLRATMVLTVKVPGPRTLEQSFRIFDEQGKGRFALGPDQWKLKEQGTYECRWYHATYPDDEYDRIASVCRWPSTCE